MKFLSLFVLFYNFAAVEGRLFGRDCSQYDNKKDCIKYVLNERKTNKLIN